MVPAASLAETSHWDNGPEFDNDYARGEEWCYEGSYCDDYYAYDGYDSEVEPSGESLATEQEDSDGLVSLPEDFVVSDMEDCDEDFTCDYDEMYAHEEYSNVEKSSNNFEDYTYEYEDEYGYEEDWIVESDAAPEESATEHVVAENPAPDEDYYEDYWYDDDYVYTYESDPEDEMSSPVEPSQDTASNMVADVEEPMAEDDFSYEFDSYEMYYGYEDGDAEIADEATADETELAEDVTESSESEWEDYYYGDEYRYYYEEYDNGDNSVAEEMPTEETFESEADAEETWAAEYEYNASDYDYYDYEMESVNEVAADANESAEMWDESYDDVDPMEQYGYEYEAWNDTEQADAEPEGRVELDLFAWEAPELLHAADCRLIRSVERLSDHPASERRACLNSYIESLGFEAIDFAYRFEDAADADVLTLADDLPSAAAFLACYRLIEQGRVEMDDAVVLLETALSGLSLEWIEDVGRISSSNEVASTSHPVVDALATAATRSIASAGTLAAAISKQLTALPWTELEGRLEEIRAAFRPLGNNETQTF